MNKQNLILFIFILICLAVQTTTAQSPKKLWFDKPATYFEERVVGEMTIIPQRQTDTQS